MMQKTLNRLGVDH